MDKFICTSPDGKSCLGFHNSECYSFENCMYKKEQVGCKYCNGEYNTELICYVVRHHTSDSSEVIEIETVFCPYCGRKINKN